MRHDSGPYPLREDDERRQHENMSSSETIPYRYMRFFNQRMQMFVITLNRLSRKQRVCDFVPPRFGHRKPFLCYSVDNYLFQMSQISPAAS